MMWLLIGVVLLFFHQTETVKCFRVGDIELSISKIYNNNTSTQTLAVYTFDNPDDIVSKDQYSVTINGEEMITGEKVLLKFESMDYTHDEHDVCWEKKNYDEINASDAVMKYYYCDYYDGKKATVTVIEKPGKSIKELRNNKRFCLKTVLQVTIQLVNALESIHSSYFTFGCVTSSTVVTDINNPSIIKFSDVFHSEYIPDIIDDMSNQLEPTIEENNLKYKSKFYMDFGQELPRDDAEAMLYVMLESLIGKLPWNDIISVPAQHISRNQIDFYKLVGKQAEVIASLIYYLQDLKFGADIDYDEVRERLKNALHAIGGNENDAISWTTYDVAEHNWKDFIMLEENEPSFIQMDFIYNRNPRM